MSKLKKVRFFTWVILSKNTKFLQKGFYAVNLSERASLVLFLTIRSKIDNYAKRTNTCTDGEYLPNH
jgi:hypothetical protein